MSLVCTRLLYKEIWIPRSRSRVSGQPRSYFRTSLMLCQSMKYSKASVFVALCLSSCQTRALHLGGGFQLHHDATKSFVRQPSFLPKVFSFPISSHSHKQHNCLLSPTRAGYSTSLALQHEDQDFSPSSTTSCQPSDEFVHLRDLNPSQVEATTQPIESITRVVAGPGAGKTRVLTCRIAELLQTDPDPSSRILAVTFTKKAAGEMQHRLEELLREQQQLDNENGVDDAPSMHQREGKDGKIFQEDAPETGDRQRWRPSLLDRVTLGTFHSVCAKILRWNGQDLSLLPSIVEDISQSRNVTNDEDESVTPNALLDGSFAIVDQSEQLRIVKECLKELDIDLKASGGGGKTDVRPITILNAVCQLKSETIMATTMGDVEPNGGKGKGGRKHPKQVLAIAVEVYPLYRSILLSHNSLDFDDLILLTRELLLTNPSVRKRLHRRWKHVLVDEFQDTSRSQLDLIKLLTTRSLLVVGDGDQSIYSWRGANVESMSDFVREFDGHRARSGLVSQEPSKLENVGDLTVNTVYLMENYRSTTNIVSAAQKIISGTPSESPSPQSAIRQDMKPMRGKGPTPRVIACSDSKAEATRVVQIVYEMESSGDITPESTIAMIYRTNAQSRALEEACVKQNLHYLVRGAAGTFYSRAEVKDCLCFLRCLYNGRDRSALTRAFKTPRRGIGEVAIREFFSYCDEIDAFRAHHYPDQPKTTPFDVLISLGNNLEETDDSPPFHKISRRSLNNILPFASQMKSIREQAKSQTVSELLAAIVEIFGLRTHFDSISKTKAEFEDRMGNVAELCSAGERYAEDGPCLIEKVDGVSPLGLFLDDVALVSETNDDSENDFANDEKRLVANLMTIHASKGKEFDVVFLVGNEEGTFPAQRSISEGEESVELEEERRLCYVAMTRAKTHLLLTWRREVTIFTGTSAAVIEPKRSRFLDALVMRKPGKRISKKKKEDNPANAESGMKRKRISLKHRLQKRDFSGVAANGRSARPNSRQGGVWVSPQRATSSTTDRIPSTTMSSTREATISTRRNPAGALSKRTRNSSQSTDGSSELSEQNRVDSTWFFPVGSFVHHTVHGKGEVLEPPTNVNVRDNMMVRIAFDGGMEIDIHADDPGLRLQL